MIENEFLISRNTCVTTNFADDVLRNAAEILTRDIERVVTDKKDKNEINLVVDSSIKKSESFVIKRVDKGHMEVRSGSSRGVMYGVLAISKQVLKIDEFWFWMDRLPKPQSYIIFDNVGSIVFPKYRVQYRGWFVNDEVLLNEWNYHESLSNVWQIVYETLLRCGGNMIIPGTGNTTRLNRDQAVKMGLIITHHHAEPLGSEMFSRVYPNLNASYLKYPNLFEKLWRDSIEKQKNDDVIWTLGFRGQGDRPFWLDDDHEYTLEDKADVINNVIRTQYDMVKKIIPNAKCAINIYGELTSLYNTKLLDIPKDVIQIWADNGYGKMISRRQGNNDPRSNVLDGGNAILSQGIYYHVAFHDLQASNFLTLFQIDPHTVECELDKVRKVGMDNFVMCNTGNIKPNILFLRLMAQSWQEKFEVRTNKEILTDYVNTYYQDSKKDISEVYQNYFDSILNYGEFKDQKAGDEFYTYTLRKIITSWISRKNKLPEMEWLTGDKEFSEELLLIDSLISNYVKPFEKLDQKIRVLIEKLSSEDSNRLYNDLLLNVVVHAYSIKALKLTIDSYSSFLENTDRSYLNSFLLASDATKKLNEIVVAWKNNPFKKWVHFFDNDCYTNISLTIELLKTLTNYIRIFGDGPDEDQWERKYLMEKKDAKIMLLSNTHKAYDDDEMALRLKARLGKIGD